MDGKGHIPTAARWARAVSMSALRITIMLVLALVVIAKFELFPVKHSLNRLVYMLTAEQRVYDEAGILPQYDRKKFEEYLHWIFTESDVDIRFVFMKDMGRKTIEEVAVEKVQELGIGGKGREERGVLLLYDLDGKQMRIEVGYGLEYYFPDAFVSYLTNEHTRAFFSAGDLSVGLRLLLRMLHHRIRQAILGDAFDPRVVEVIRKHRYLSGGAGVSEAVPIGRQRDAYLRDSLTEKKRKLYYSPQPTPEAVFEKYMEWLASGRFDPRVDIFTPKSQRYIASIPMSRAYFDYILMLYYGKKYRVDTRGDLALLYFTDDPFASPLFFVKGERGWQLNIISEVRNLKNMVGGIYTWNWIGRKDIFTEVFADRLVNINGYVRIRGGDNRKLTMRSKWNQFYLDFLT